MALPFSRDTTYVAGVTPYIAAATENDIQNYIVHAFQGTRSIKSMMIDGVSDVVPTNPAGTVQLTTSGSGAGPGATTAVTWGVAYREAFPLGFCRVTEAAGVLTFQGGYNIDTVTRNALGDYTVTFGSAPTNADRCAGFANCHFSAAAFIIEVNSFSIAAGKLSAQLFVYNAAGAPADSGFTLVVFGG